MKYIYLLQPDPHGKGKRVSVMVDPEEIERERLKAQQEEQLVLDLIGMDQIVVKNYSPES